MSQENSDAWEGVTDQLTSGDGKQFTVVRSKRGKAEGSSVSEDGRSHSTETCVQT